MYSRHRVVDAFPEDPEEAVLATGSRGRVEDQHLVRAVGHDLQPLHRVRQVVEDPLEQADVEALLSEAIVDLEQVADFEPDWSSVFPRYRSRKRACPIQCSRTSKPRQ